MARFLKSRKSSHGASPGSLIFIGNRKMEKSEIHLIAYNKETLIEKQIDNLDEIQDDLPDESVLWINIYGLQDTQLIEKIGEKFTIPPLELEDILNTDQRPKIIENENNLTVFLKVLEYDQENTRVAGDHISMVVGNNYVITFQERVARYFEPVRERIRSNKGRIRKTGPDYLAYALIDTLVDGYLQSIENLGAVIENMEEEVFTETRKEIVQKIYRLKMNVSFIRKSVFPLKEMMLVLNKTESKFIQKKTYSFFKDLLDLSTQAMEAVDIYYNMTNDYLNIYHANVGNRTNDVMKVLTIFASIFIPLTFIAGVYGTNFDFLPELHFQYSYFIMLGVMAVIAGAMLYYFKRKDWL
ncbi:magnesium/cobalt transporter CorA [Maribellus maritimus]|uniref:magnesium/cobalt transporter CorA n=1 Tax=Maribellus maritimus TaxID=2870838 RepID=UPI001EEB5ECE|nr:magnesium/cobalt transporter CorA [Maribellus maritimus]MCG6185938.1 magnesium/cobalt transporter CorA [Maribellus maritimus]